MSDDHERIWLEPASLDGRYGCEGRLWCHDKVWPENEGEPEPTEYIRADIVASLRAELAAAKERAEKAEGERDACAKASDDWVKAFLAAEAKAEGLAKALEVAEGRLRFLSECVSDPNAAEAIVGQADEAATALTAYRTDQENGHGH